ncbi:MAG: hypothetical protein IJB79_05320 [Candidatus Gastranaerophilales bacterium]|nr:hypothetical protein [Candidatus Gastranaerophilales bacterium]
MKSIDKKNSLYIIKLLMKGKASKEEISNSLNIGNSTFYRHINLIKKVGFDIKKQDDSFELLQYENLFKFEECDLSVFVYLLLIAYVMLSCKKFEIFYGAVQKMICLTNQKDFIKVKKEFEKYRMNSIGSYYSEKTAILKKYLESKSYVNVVIKNLQEQKIMPLEFKWEKEKLLLVYLDENNETKQVLLDNLTKIIEDEVRMKISHTKETIFELYGRLAKSYLLKDEERVVDFTRNKIVIANASKDKEKLFKRLLRYDILCKVVFPKSDVADFKAMIEKSLDNIEEFLDNI